MSEAVAKTVIDISRDQAWKKLSDLSLAHNYVPGIVKTEITTDKKQGVDTSRKVYQGPNKWMQETVTDWNEGYGFSIRLHKGDKDVPFKNAFFHYPIDDAGPDKTALTMIMNYDPPLGWLGKPLVDQCRARLQFKKCRLRPPRAWLNRQSRPGRILHIPHEWQKSQSEIGHRCHRPDWYLSRC